MSPSRKSRLAAAIGVTLAACAAPAHDQAVRSEEVMGSPESLGVGLFWTRDPPSDPPCPRFQDGLHVSSDELGERIEPLVRADSGRHGLVAFAEYGYWAEKKWVTVVNAGPAGGRVQAAHDTDYGFYVGSLASEVSAHLHGDALCFDFTVIRGDSLRFERWRGELRLPKAGPD